MASTRFSKSLRDQLVRLLTDLRAASNPDRDSTRRFFSRGSRYVGLDATQVAACSRIVSAIRKHIAPAGEWSAETIQGHLEGAIIAVRHSQEQDFRGPIAEEVASLEAALSSETVPWKVHFRLEGLNQDCLPLIVGRTSLFPGTVSLVDQVVRADGEESVNLPESMRDQIRAHVRQEIREEFAQHVWARVAVAAAAADSAAAHDLANEHLQLTLDVLNFFADIWRPRSYRSRVTLGCEIPPGSLNVLTVQEGQEPGGLSMKVLGPVDDVWLPPLDSDEAASLGLDRIAALLGHTDTDHTEISRRLLAALRWAGRATLARRHDEALLLYLIALEGLVMGPKKSGTILYQLARRLAHLFSESGLRKEIVEDVEDLYDLRSRLVHTGAARVDDSHVERARFLTKEAVIAVVRGTEFAAMKKDSELDDWFECRILGHK